MKKVILLALLAVLNLWANGDIDWSKRVIQATGIGAPNPNAPNMASKRAGAINAAKMYALKELVATIKGMYISANSTVEDYITTSDQISGQVEGIAKAYQIVDKKYFEDGSVEVTVEMSIDGNLSDLFLKNDSFNSEGDNSEFNSNPGSENGNMFTGLIIDCRGFELRPALSPKILSKSGNEIYGSAKVSREFAIQQGMMGYLKDIEIAKSNLRVGKNPLIIKAAGINGQNKTNIIIDDATAQKLAGLNENLNFLRQCKVIAIVN